MLRRILYSCIALLLSDCVFAQEISIDSVTKTLGEVIVTATRTKKNAVDVPLPVQIISKSYIQNTGSQKLMDILQQQTGLVLADNPLGAALQGYPNPFGAGIQMQGLDPAYSLILVDGEPLTGRNAGILNLGRIAIGNIKQIEIVKGPATSLYGSSAMAGVINIITERPESDESDFQLHYGSHNTLGLTGNAFIKTKKTGIQLFANRYSSDGYDLDKAIYGKTVDPFTDYSFNAKISYQINSSTQILLSVRYFSEKQFNNYLVYVGSTPSAVKGNTTEKDKSINTQLLHNFSEKVKGILRLYTTGYENNASVFTEKTNDLFEKMFLNQFLLKPEMQIEIGDKKNKFIAGGGYNYETINSSRYTNKKNLDAAYVFMQQELQRKDKINIIVGARLDKSTLYKAQFSPKIAIGYKANKKITFNASMGTGFKTPDFRQLFLNFTNSLVGYTLLGASELSNGLSQLKQNGQIDSSVNITPYLGTHDLLPEKSTGINIGMKYSPFPSTNFSLNIFRNDIKNLIETYNLPFTKINNQAIFSYVNVSKVYTEGFDVNISNAISKSFNISGGYQFLIAKDKDVIKSISEKKIYKRDPVTYNTTLVDKSEYGGLFNRSAKTANLQLLYDNKTYKFNVFLRGTYRGRFGYSDINGNNILDDDREYVKGFMMFNITASKEIIKGLQIQSGIDNILNHTDKLKLPNLPGRVYFINCNFNLNKKNKLKHNL